MAYTVKQLIEVLQGFPDDMMVVSTSRYGDYADTELAHGVGCITKKKIQFSGYHEEWNLPEEFEDDEVKATVVVLKMAESDELMDELEERGFLEGNEED